MSVKNAQHALARQFFFTTILLGITHQTKFAYFQTAGNSSYVGGALLDICTIGTIWLVLAALARHGRLQPLIHVIAIAAFLAIILIGPLTIAYGAMTGDILDLRTLFYSVTKISEIGHVIISATSPLLWLLIAIPILMVATVLAFPLRTGLAFATSIAVFLSLGISNAISGTHNPGKDSLNNLSSISPELEATWLRNQSPPSHHSILLSFVGYPNRQLNEFKKLKPSQAYSSPTYISQRGQRPNILLITLESVSAISTSVYRAQSNMGELTPHLSRFASSGLVVDRVYTTVPHTSKALVGILCGQFPNRTMKITDAEEGGLPFNCLPRLLKPAGYKTAYFQSAHGSFENRHGLLKNIGFEYWRTQEQFDHTDLPTIGYFGMDDKVMLNPAIDWMMQQKAQSSPFFVSLLTVISHHPYATSESLPDISSLPKAKAAYSQAVRHTDAFIGSLIEQMEIFGLLKNTLVIITGDHGEAFGEHGPVMHNGAAYEEGIRVPMVLYGPDVLRRTGRIDGLRQHTDLVPSILELAGIQIKGNIPGRSIFSTDGHENIVGHCWYEDYCVVSINSAGEKMIYWYEKRPTELFDLIADPSETDNLALAADTKSLKIRVQNAFQMLADKNSIYSN